MRVRIPAFESIRILIVGDVMLDRYWHGPAARISPEAPVPVVKVEQTEERPGGAANVAVNVATLGGGVRVLGVIGGDEAGQALAARLERLGVDAELLRLDGRATVTKLRVLSRHQQLLRLDFEDGFPDLDPRPLQQLFADSLPEADAVVLSDYGKGTLREAPYYIRAARAAGRPVLVDPKGPDFSRYHGATLITPNLAELEAVVGPCRSDAVLVEKGNALLAALELEALLITRSEHGVSLLRRDAEPLHVPARSREVFDVTGAGDTIVAFLAAGLAAGMELAGATALANLAAGIVVGKLGTAGVTVSELRRALYEHDEPPRGVIGQEPLLRAVADAKAHGETIVMTNGCFDILHAGHVACLEQARRLGNRLIVAVNDDASVRRLKGAGRPVNSLERRMQVLAGLAAVDWVVAFGEDTPERLIRRVRPDYLVKGGDNDPGAIPGGRWVRESGGQVVVVDYLDGCSTTGTIARILESP